MLTTFPQWLHDFEEDSCRQLLALTKVPSSGTPKTATSIKTRSASASSKDQTDDFTDGNEQKA